MIGSTVDRYELYPPNPKVTPCDRHWYCSVGTPRSLNFTILLKVIVIQSLLTYIIVKFSCWHGQDISPLKRTRTDWNAVMMSDSWASSLHVPFEAPVKRVHTIVHFVLICKIQGQQCWVTEGLSKPPQVHFRRLLYLILSPFPNPLEQVKWEVDFHGTWSVQLRPLFLAVKLKQERKKSKAKQGSSFLRTSLCACSLQFPLTTKHTSVPSQ